MGIIIRQSFYNSISGYIGVAIGYVNILVLFPAIFTTEQIGLTRVIQDAAILLVPLAQIGMTQSVLRYFPKVNKENINSLITLALVGSAGGYLLFLLVFRLLDEQIASLFSNRAAAVIENFGLILILIATLMVINIQNVHYRSLLKSVLPNFLKDVLLRLMTSFGLILYYFEYLSFNFFLYFIVGSYLLNAIVMLVSLVWNEGFRLSFSMAWLTKKKRKDILVYSMYTMIGTSGIMIVGKVDSLMVTVMLNLDLAGIYTTVFYIAVVLELPKRAINQIGMPIISRGFQTNNLTEIADLYKKSALNQMIIGTLLFIGITINLDSLFLLMSNGSQFAIGKWVVIIVGFGKLIDMSAGMNSEIIILSKHYKFNIVLLAFLAIFTIASNWILIGMYGIIGAAIGTALAFLFFNLAKLIFIHVKLKMQPFHFSNLKVVVLGGITLLIGIYTPKIGGPLVDVFARSVIVTVFYGTIVLALNLSSDISDICKNVLRKLRVRW